MKSRTTTTLGLLLAATLSMTVTACSTTPVSDVAAPTSTPPPSQAPVTVDELGSGSQDAAVDLEVAGPTQLTFRRITISPGAGTGLHCHDGQLLAVVEQGVLTHYAPIYPTGVHEYATGDSIHEGVGYIHEGRNEGTEDVVLLVTYVVPEGMPLAETDLSKCDHQE